MQLAFSLGYLIFFFFRLYSLIFFPPKNQICGRHLAAELVFRRYDTMNTTALIGNPEEKAQHEKRNPQRNGRIPQISDDGDVLAKE